MTGASSGRHGHGMQPCHAPMWRDSTNRHGIFLFPFGNDIAARNQPMVPAIIRTRVLSIACPTARSP